MQRLWKSSKFWLLVFDVVTSITLYFVGKYALNAMEDVKFLVVTIQPVFALVITGIFVEDAALKAQR